jgi:hypothetical protein
LSEQDFEARAFGLRGGTVGTYKPATTQFGSSGGRIRRLVEPKITDARAGNGHGQWTHRARNLSGQHRPELGISRCAASIGAPLTLMGQFRGEHDGRRPSSDLGHVIAHLHEQRVERLITLQDCQALGTMCDVVRNGGTNWLVAIPDEEPWHLNLNGRAIE